MNHFPSPMDLAAVQNMEFQSPAALRANALVAQTVSQSQEAAALLADLVALQHPQDSQSVSMHNIGAQIPSVFCDDDFDGKNSPIVCVEAHSFADREAVILLHEACKKDDINVITSVLEAFPASTRMVLNETINGDIALHIAAKHGNDATVKVILHMDADCALIRNNGGHTPLHLAVQNGHLAPAMSLTTRAPRCAQIQCEEGFLPLHDAVSEGAHHPDTPQIITILLNGFKSAVFVVTDEGFLPIHFAASSGFSAALRTLLSAEFRTIFIRDKLENLLPLDISVHELSETTEEAYEQASQDGELNKRRDQIVSCIEILLSSMLYNRLISSPRDIGNGDYPFLPLHGAIHACPLLKTWRALFPFYREEHSLDIDELGRNIAHKICSREIHNTQTDVSILQDLGLDLFLQRDHFGFIPLHLSLQNRNVPIEFVKAVAECNKSSLCQDVRPIHTNKYSRFLPLLIASNSQCDLDILFFLLKSHPTLVQPFVSYNKNGVSLVSGGTRNNNRLL